jgi:hypothetical protein
LNVTFTLRLRREFRSCQYSSPGFDLLAIDREQVIADFHFAPSL